MAKSVPGSSVLVHDDPKEIREKILAAYCPPKATLENPVLEIVRLILMPQMGDLDIERPAKYGGKVTYGRFQDIEREYASGQLHPQDLKEAVARSLSRRLEGVRQELATCPELMKRVLTMDITR